MTLIGCGNAVGDTIPPFCIFKQWPTEDWDVSGFDEDVRFARSETAFNNRELMLDWIRLFNKHSFLAHAEFKRREVTLEEWFGCDEHFKSNGNSIKPDDCAKEDAIRMRTPLEERVYRLLVLDSFTGHHDLELYEYCIQFDIVIVFLPPHSSHKTQPLDVGVFRHLKDAHQRRLRNAVRAGALSFSRADFVDGFNEIWKAGFQRKYIMAGFEKTGIFPPNRHVVIDQLADTAKKYNTPAFPSMLPDEERWREAKLGIERIEQKYQHLFSSPTRERVRAIASTLHEGELARNYIAKTSSERKKRLAKHSTKKNRRSAIKPSGEVITSISVKEIRRQQELRRQQDALAIRKESQKAVDSIYKRMEKEYKEEWMEWKRRPENKIVVNGRLRMRTFKEFLEATNKRDFIPLEERKAKAKEEPFFVIDTQGSPRLVEDLEMPLRDMTPLPPSPRGIRVNADQPFEPFSDDDVVSIPSPVNDPSQSTWANIRDTLAKWREKKAARRGGDEALSSSEGSASSGNEGEGGDTSDVEHREGLQEYEEVTDSDDSDDIEVVV